MAWKEIPQCPASNCLEKFRSGRYPDPLKGDESWLPDHVRSLATQERLLKCRYCGLVWYWSSGKGSRFDAIPLGRHDAQANSLVQLLPGIKMVGPRKTRIRTTGGPRGNDRYSRR